MFSYYKKKLSNYQEKGQYSTTSESKTAVVGSIAMTNIQYYCIFLMLARYEMRSSILVVWLQQMAMWCSFSQNFEVGNLGLMTESLV